MAQIEKLKEILEVALLTSGQPLSVEDLSRLFIDKTDRSTIRMLLDEIKNDWQDKSMNLIQVATGYRFQAKSNFTEFLMRLTPDRAPNYSRAVLEVLAIIAYRQPVTRADIEKIRGVSLSSNTLRQLIEREWIDIIGQKEVPGRPSLYATTKHFLNDFALKSLSELPELNSSLSDELSNTDDNDIVKSSNKVVDSNIIDDEKDFSNNIIPPAK
ncbi:MAG: SMC-Scp complex subunit ScpB [Nitrosomonadales bacterium]|nr:SMC-Scp complex subunit ScpB [Nitrosomonadales bacterium]|tara:strand:+ start:616 stop:1254 length:639 start_codon:yes stop_codon:yes gene_type:complete